MKIHSVEEDVYILAIESSCDETAASVVKNGREVLSNVISSQIALHTLYGGVVPEIASRKHIEKVNQVVQAALDEAHMTLGESTAIAVTYGPGLVGCSSCRSCRCEGDRLCGKETAGPGPSHRGTCFRELYRASGSGAARLSARSCPADIPTL